jgi:hypothetical protein
MPIGSQNFVGSVFNRQSGVGFPVVGTPIGGGTPFFSQRKYDFSITVNPAQSASTTTLTSSVNPSILGESVTFTASVQASGSVSATPGGSVDFVDTTTNTDLGTFSLSGGSASVSTSDLAVGAHVIQANYGGDPDFLPSTDSLTQNVDYNFSGFLPPLDHNLSFGAGRTVPVKFQLTDFNGNFISDLNAVTALQVVYPDGSTHAIPGLRYDSNDNQFIANWGTEGLSAGSYTISLSLLDGTTHTVTVQITAGSAKNAQLASDGYLLLDSASFLVNVLDGNSGGR